MEEPKGTADERAVTTETPPEATDGKTRVEQLGKTGKPSDRSHVIYQLMAAGAVGVGSLVSLMAMGYTSPALPSMRADPNFSITQEQESWVGAVMPACGLLGSVAAGPLVDHWGSRATLLHLSWPFMLSWALVAVSGGVGGVVVGRMLNGVCVGVLTAARSVLLPEVIQLELRGVASFFPSVCSSLGLLVSYAAGKYLSWRGLAWLGVALCLPMAALLLPLPETPYHLTRTGRREESLAALQQLRRSTRDAEREQQEISSSCSRDRKDVSVWELAQPPNLWAVGVAAALMLGQQATGFSAVAFFASSILEAGGGGLGSGMAMPLLGVVNVVGSVGGMFLMARYRRRPLLLLSSTVLVASLLTLALFFWAREAGGAISVVAETLHLVPVAALLVYMLGSTLGWRAVPWIFLGEGIPSRVRGKAVAAVVAIHWATTFLVTKSFGWSLATVGAHGTFLGYAVATAVSTTLILRAMPETFGLSTVQVDQLYLQAANKKHK